MPVHQGRITVVSWIPSGALPAPFADFFDDDGVTAQPARIDDAISGNALRVFHDVTLKVITNDGRTVSSFEDLSTFRANASTLSMWAIIRNAAVGGAGLGFLNPVPGSSVAGFIGGLLLGLITGAIGQLLSFDPENLPAVRGTQRVTVGNVEGIQMWSIQGSLNNFADNTAGFIVNVPPIISWLEVTVLANGCKRFVVRDLSAFPKHSIYLDDDLWRETTPDFSVFSDVDADFNPWVNQAGYLNLKRAQLQSADGLDAFGYFRGDYDEQVVEDCDIASDAVTSPLPAIQFFNRDGERVEVDTNEKALKEPEKVGAVLPGPRRESEIAKLGAAAIGGEELASRIVLDLLRQKVISSETVAIIQRYAASGAALDYESFRRAVRSKLANIPTKPNITRGRAGDTRRL